MRALLVLAAAVAFALAFACGGGPDEPATAAALAPLPPGALPETEACAECHPATVAKWLQHGMADALGPLDPGRVGARPDGSWVEHAPSGFRYRVEEGEHGWILAQELSAPPADLPPPRREIELVARIGAGVQDLAFAAAERGRWFFSPLEHMRGAGWTHAPFQQAGAGAGLGFRIGAECLGCHTDAATPRPWPENELGALRPRGISCAACHGSSAEHVERMRAGDTSGGSCILDPATLPPARQIDLCARCHLEGDAMLDLLAHRPFLPGEDLLARRVVLVAAEPGARPPFVGQVQRLAASACFRGSPEMTCTTCHDPHLPPRLQERARLLSACADCHDAAAHPPVAEEPGADCASCHMPRVEPFDLPGALTADHWIRRAPPAPPPLAGFREHESPEGNWEAFRYRRDDPAHDARRVAAVRALARASHGRLEEAAAALSGGLPADFPATAWLLRAQALEGAGRAAEARAAYEEVLARDPGDPEARLRRGWLLLEDGRAAEALAEARALASAYPRADAPWMLAAAAHSALGATADAARALQESLARYPAQPAPLQRLGRAALASGDRATAARALFAAWSLEPRLPGLAEELRSLR